MIMKINKYILGLATIVLGGLYSCNTDVESTIYNSNLEHVSFDATSATISVSVNETSATIPVTINRGVIANASTVTFTAEASEEGIFSNDANGSVTFEAGQNKATFNVTAKNLEKDQSYTYTLKLSDAAIETADTITNVKQNKVFTIKVSRAGDWTEWTKWNSTGTATFIYSAWMSGDDPGLPFTYRTSLNNKDKYQFKLEKWFYGVEVIFDYDASTGYVTCAPQFTGYTHSTYGDVYVSDIGTYKGDAATPADYGKFDEEQGIFTIPLIYYVDAGYFGYGPEQLLIDGYVRADYTASLTYAGVMIDPNNIVYALGDLVATGKDAKNAKNIKAVVVSQDVDPAAIADAIATDEYPAEKVTLGRIQVAIPENMSGKLQLIVVFIDNDEVKNVLSTNFEYYTGDNPWKSLGACYFTDDIFYPFFTGADPITYQVEIEENKETPGLYRLKTPFAYYASWWTQAGQSGDGAEDIIVNAEDADGVYILNQPLGLSHKSLGDMSFETEGGYYVSLGKYSIATLKQYGMLGSLKDGVITFPVFQETDGDGNPQTDDDGNPLLYQGWLNFSGGNYYTTGNNGAIQIVLPNANPASVAKAKRAAAASNFELRLNPRFSKNASKKNNKRKIMKLHPSQF